MMFWFLTVVCGLAAGLVSYGMWYGAHQCVVREELQRDPERMLLKGLTYAGGIALAVFMAGVVLRHFGHGVLAESLLFGTAMCEFGIGATLISAGCM
jgi:hypothetical protein